MATTTTRTTTLTEAQGRFLHEPNYGVVAALRSDGTPHQTVVWVDWDGEHVLLNTTPERAKLGYLEDDPSVSVLVVDRDDPYRWLSISGRVDEITPDGAEEHIHRQARRYMGKDRYPLQEGERRLLVKIAPRRVTDYGVDA